MLKPFECERDRPLDLVIENENPDDAREHCSQLAQLRRRASAHGCESHYSGPSLSDAKGTPVAIDRTHSSERDVGMAVIAKILI
jgi:hypothetical protein